jgi:hypothetical protein
MISVQRRMAAFHWAVAAEPQGNGSFRQQSFGSVGRRSSASGNTATFSRQLKHRDCLRDPFTSAALCTYSASSWPSSGKIFQVAQLPASRASKHWPSSRTIHPRSERHAYLRLRTNPFDVPCGTPGDALRMEPNLIHPMWAMVTTWKRTISVADEPPPRTRTTVRPPTAPLLETAPPPRSQCSAKEPNGG